MSIAGRKSAPTVLKLLEGVERKDRINQNEPKPGNPCLEYPDYLIDEAKKVWNKYALPLKKLGVFKQIDEFSFETLCQECGRWVDLQKIISDKVKKDGYVTKNTRQGDKPIPEMAMARECLKNIRALMVEFGMTPSSRSRISVEENPGEVDPMQKILEGK